MADLAGTLARRRVPLGFLTAAVTLVFAAPTPRSWAAGLAVAAAGELVRVREPVSLNLEVTEIADRAMKQPGGGKALLFERPVLMNGQPSGFPVGINLFGSMRRMSLALGVQHGDRLPR